MREKFVTAFFLLCTFFVITGFWFGGPPGLYMREDASNDKTFVTEIKTGEGTLKFSNSVATVSLSSYDISDDPGSTYTLDADDLTGRRIITNDGAGATRIFNLPDVPADIDTTTDVYVAYIYCEEDQSIDINPHDSDWIRDLTDATGDAIETKGVGNFIVLITHDSTGWYPHMFIGTWNDIN